MINPLNKHQCLFCPARFRVKLTLLTHEQEQHRLDLALLSGKKKHGVMSRVD